MSKENQSIADKEKEIQKFWQDNKIFEKSLEQAKTGSRYSFYDGPPFATGTPHYGHLVASLMKDVVPRFWTMRGSYVERRWGWDCHGLPIENIVEKELGFKSKKDIEDYGVDKFNTYCRSKVLTYAEEWKKTIARFGRWVDMENAYKTMDLSYMESIWWVFKQLWDKGLIYEGYKSMHICPRCETTLSQSEVTEGYRDIKDISVTVKFELVDEPGTCVLAWTTTPWTLPGNVALAIGEEVKYVLAEKKNLEKGEEQEKVIIAKIPFEASMVDDYKVIQEFSGHELVGKKYHPLFPYYLDKDVPNKENLYTIVSADFVTTEDGTGVVHIAPAYGEEDLQLGKEKNLSFIQNVNLSGNFKEEVADLAGLNVKPVDDTKATDRKVIEYLKKNDLLFAEYEYEHSYPHCWRCDTPLINYSTSSWFVKVTALKERAMELAKNINWSPEHIKEGRFGQWLEGARDWSISRQRFWASVIPIWKCSCGEMKVLGSVDELYKNSRGHSRPITKIILVRHGEAENNLEHIFSSANDKYSLTASGREQILEMAKQIHQEVAAELAEVVIFSSPILRTKQSAEMISQELGKSFELADDLHEISFGSWEDRKKEDLDQHDELRQQFNLLTPEEKYKTKYGGNGESEAEVQERMFSWLEKTVDANQGKTIIIVSHGDPIMDLISKVKSRSATEAAYVLENDDLYIHKGQSRTLFIDSENKLEIDLHKHSIDRIALKCEKCGNEMSRVPDVLDTWFDSGSMPYAQQHYPFENKKKFEAGFPAEFIAEGVDQCRAWFYYLHVNSTAIMEKVAYRNVIANGIVLAGDGKKMSKRLANYTEPEIIMEKYGADALRYYLLTSPVMQAENLNFDDNGVKEAMQKVVMLLNNILSFYKLYEDKLEAKDSRPEADNVLDQWLIAKLNLLVKNVTENMEVYDLPRAVRPIQEFIDEFSTWWLRRSRDRFKGDDELDRQRALVIFRHALLELSKSMAPFTPFIAEQVYREVGGELESVHLEKWPVVGEVDEKILSEMEQVRKIVELGLAKRAEAGIKIRQPLTQLKISSSKFKVADELLNLIAEELNIKKIIFSSEVEEVELDTVMTEELKLEGMVRELIRTINNLRKDAGLTVGDNISVAWQSTGPMVQKALTGSYLDEIKKATISQDFIQQDNGSKEIVINGEKIQLEIKKI